MQICRRSLCGGRGRVGWGRGRGKEGANKDKKIYKNKKDHHRGAGYNHLSIIARGGQVVAWGFNSLCSGPQASVHSEVTALRALFSRHGKAGPGRAGSVGRGRQRRGGRCRRRRRRRRVEGGGGLDLINVRFTFDCLRISRPCRRCWLFLNKHLWRFRKVMYTTSEGAVVCLSADEFAADPPDHVSKGHRLDYYSGGRGGSGGSSGGGGRSKKKMPRGGDRGRGGAGGCGSGCGSGCSHA